VKEIEIEARGMTFQALADGPQDGPLLLLLHGLPLNRWEWHHQNPPWPRWVSGPWRPTCAGSARGPGPRESRRTI
jgi:pimeloyl-ACP methyl ester carboxylesterase